MTHKEFTHTAGLDEDFHTYGLYWDEDRLYTYLDTPSNIVLDVDFTSQSMWEKGQFPSNMHNPWVGEPNSAPFNREFYLIMNVAVGGTNAYFPDGIGGKPWADADPKAVNNFYNTRGTW